MRFTTKVSYLHLSTVLSLVRGVKFGLTGNGNGNNGIRGHTNARNHDLKLIEFSSDYNIHEYPPTDLDNEPLSVGFQVIPSI